MHETYDTIIRDCMAEALLLPREELQNELLTLGLSSANDKALEIWLAWKWDNEKVDEFTAPAADASGIITFAATVESIMAVKKVDGTTDYTTHIWAQDEYLAAILGETVSSDRFQHLSASATGARRILVPIVSPVATYKVLALCKYTKAIVDPAYSAATPSATPTDYRVQLFLIDRALPALKAAVKDSFRRSWGLATEGNFKALLRLALDRETYDSGRERRSVPQSPMMEEVGGWDEE